MEDYVGSLGKFGNFVHVTRSFWDGEATLTPEDLGLSEIPENFLLGKMKLIQKKELNKFTSLAQESMWKLSEVSFKTPLSGTRFVPNSVFPIFKQTTEHIKIRYGVAVRDFKKNYLKNKLLMRQSFVDAAFKAYDQGKKEVGRNTFVNNFLERVEKLYPKPADLDSRFKIAYSVYGLSEPSFEDKELQDKYKIDLSIKFEKCLEDMIYEIRGRIKEPFQRVITYLDEGKNISKATIGGLKKAVKSFEVLNTFVNDIPTQQGLDRLKTELLFKGPLLLMLKDIEVREELRIRLWDILKTASHQDSNELAFKTFKNRVLGKDGHAEP